MPIILKCRDVSGSASFPSGMVEGLPQPERHYRIDSNLITLDGYPDTVLRHDMLELLSMPDGLYRMLTPQEQSAQAAQAQAALTAVESGVPTPQADSANTPPKGKTKSDTNGG
jgi:hypothetical protein